MDDQRLSILHKEIDLIQECIKRMANNSFLIKGWTITLISVVLALTSEKIELLLTCLILLIPVLGFWYLDSFFLQTEKMYRKMYEWVIKYRPSTDEKLYDLNPHLYKNQVDSIFKVMFSQTLRIFYGIPTTILLIIILCKLIG
jgi:hypothetical protein